MGTTAQKLQALANSKAAIKAAIEAKGVSDVGNVFSTYATKISQIPSGGSSGDPRYEVNGQGQLMKKQLAVDYFNNVTSLADSALKDAYRNSNVTSASFPNMTRIGNNGMEAAFQTCTLLTSIDLSKVTSIGSSGLYYTFYGCTYLRTVYLSSLSSSGSNGLNYTFYGCTNLELVDFS